MEEGTGIGYGEAVRRFDEGAEIAGQVPLRSRDGVLAGAAYPHGDGSGSQYGFHRPVGAVNAHHGDPLFPGFQKGLYVFGGKILQGG